MCRRSKNRCKLIYKGSGVFRSCGCRSRARDLERDTKQCSYIVVNMYATSSVSIYLLATPCHPPQKINLMCFRVQGIILENIPLKGLEKNLLFKKTFRGLEPYYDWQLDVTEAIFLGLDCVVIAGTGSGKTMPFAMPLLVDRTKKKMVIKISLLNDLEEVQVSNLYKFFFVKTHSRKFYRPTCSKILD